MKTRQLAKVLEPAFRAYQGQIMPGTYWAARLQLQTPKLVMARREELEMSLTWRDAFNRTAAKLMKSSGFDIKIAYVYANEIHLLVSEDCCLYQRDLQRSLSALASEATLAFSYDETHPGVFDCRIVALPTWEYVFDYFSHQRTNCRSYAINSLCASTMALTFPDMKQAEINKRMSTMDHAARLQYAQSYAILHRKGTHLCPWYEYGHLLKWTWYKKQACGDHEAIDALRIDMRHALPADGNAFYDYFCDAVLNPSVE